MKMLFGEFLIDTNYKWTNCWNEISFSLNQLLHIGACINFQISESWSYPPLNDTAEAARRVHEAVAERGWRLRP